MTYPGTRLNLLVVDDEEQILELLDLTLTMQGFQVYPAANGPAALDQLARQSVDVIVMDVLMTPWDGFDTVRRMFDLQGGALPPVVFLSGLARPAVMPELGDGVITEYVVKPFRPSQLVEVIERAYLRWQQRGI
ncbi:MULTISPECIES: response regulator [unclassified Deinococcus]|uniref:response regulator n=1 Tax=unclassified Deinococcus TaxID=2623546 RepID=UPI001C88FE96|nr:MULTISPECIES: response regulator [unclassified Deinococcus]MBX8465676.1 response regulator [Deinococcus sp. RIT780]MCD0158723.1 response regulator [Deinococcus sp. 6GRE01]MCD0166073.1 response regulator [Deinococcus sp. 12RED42]